MKFRYILFLVLGFICVACGKNEIDSVPSSRVIRFSAESTPSTKTYYASDNYTETDKWLQMYWGKDDNSPNTDKIYICYPQANTEDYVKWDWVPNQWNANNVVFLKSTTYDVTRSKIKNNGTISATNQGRELVWGDLEKPNDFYAIYAGTSMANCGNDGVYFEHDGGPSYQVNAFSKAKNAEFTYYRGDVPEGCQCAAFLYPRIQVLTINKLNSNYIAYPNMEYAYMVARRTVKNPKTYFSNSSNEVFLDFKPIMSTWEFTVDGPDKGSISIYSIHVKLPQNTLLKKEEKWQPVSFANGETYFEYIITNSGDDKGSAKTGLSAPHPAGNSEDDGKDLTFILSEPVTLDSNKSFTFTLIIPPIALGTNYEPHVVELISDSGTRTVKFFDKKRDDYDVNIVNFTPDAKVRFNLGKWNSSTKASAEVIE